MSHWGGTGQESVRRINVRFKFFMYAHIHFIVYKHMNVKTLWFYHFRYDISCFEFNFIPRNFHFRLSLSIFILSYCILIVFSNFTVWNHFYFRSLSDRLSDLSKVSMMICRWYFLLIDFHTEGDFWSGKINEVNSIG